MLAIVGALMIGGAIYFMVYSTKKAAALSEAEARFSLDIDSDENKFETPIYIKFTRPLLKDGYLDIGHGFYSQETKDKVKLKLASAGILDYVQAEHFLAARFWFTAIVTFLFLMIVMFTREPPGAMFVGGSIAFAYFMPTMDINSKIKKRQHAIRLAMPYVTDLLTLSMEAGLDFMGAISKVAEKAPQSALIDELSTVLKEIQLGKTRAQALKDMSERVNMLEVSSFVAVIVSADQMGASVGTALRGQSDSMRAERLARAEKLGAQASQKILIPLVFFILPAIFLMIFGPIALSALGVK